MLRVQDMPLSLRVHVALLCHAEFNVQCLEFQIQKENATAQLMAWHIAVYNFFET